MPPVKLKYLPQNAFLGWTHIYNIRQEQQIFLWSHDVLCSCLHKMASSSQNIFIVYLFLLLCTMAHLPVPAMTSTGPMGVQFTIWSTSTGCCSSINYSWHQLGQPQPPRALLLLCGRLPTTNSCRAAQRSTSTGTSLPCEHVHLWKQTLRVPEQPVQWHWRL